MVNGDTIEVFHEMRGGGRPQKKNIFGDTIKIQNILDSVSDCEEKSDSSFDENKEDGEQSQSMDLSKESSTQFPRNNMKKESRENNLASKATECEGSQEITPSHEHVKLEGHNKEIKVETEGKRSKEKRKSDNETNASVDSTIATEESSDECIKVLRQDYLDGKFKKDNIFDLKIIHFLKMEKLAPVEINMLQTLVKRKEFFEKNNLFSKKVTKKEKKKKLPNVDVKYSKSQPETRSKSLLENVESDTMEDTFIGEAYCEDETDETCDNELNQCLTNTPQQRTKLMSKFDIKTPSPFKKLTKITEEDMKRLSIAIHLWAENKFGGIKMLQEVRLTENNFQEILSLAGPGSKYNIMKHKSIVQLKNLWRNNTKSKKYFRGHPETGFETVNKLHSSSCQFCPFEHYKSGILGSLSPLETDMVLLTPKTRKDTVVYRQAPIGRQLFESENGKRKDANETLPHPTASPTKEELKMKIQLLFQENKKMKLDLGIEKEVKETSSKLMIKPKTPILLVCKAENCGKEFASSFGLMKHQKKNHSNENIDQTQETCPVCCKVVVQIDKHLKFVHRDLITEDICDICQKTIKTDMKKHRGICISCPVCGKIEKKKMRLLKHIIVCRKLKGRDLEQTCPLDLTSPQKNHTQKINQNTKDEDLLQAGTDETTDSPKLINITPLEIEDVPAEHNYEDTVSNETPIENVTSYGEDAIVESISFSKGVFEDKLNQKRFKFPFDPIDGEEAYLSEYEDGDSEDFTKQRRQNKDDLERRLREIDELQCEEYDGDDEILAQFRSFMQEISQSGETKGEYSNLNEPSTVGMYTRAVQNDILRAFHELFNPFDSRWLIDCTTKKVCTFEGEERHHVSPEEPIYLTSRVLRKALEKYDSGETGTQRATAVAATLAFMNYIELHFNNRLNQYGREPLEKVMTYHNGVKSFINGTKAWKACNKEKERSRQNNKALKDYQNPNHEAEILERFKKYIDSPERLDQIRKILKYSSKEASKPSNKEMTEIGRIAMGEIIYSTGCRPVVAYRLTVGAWVSKKPGFDPLKVTEDDCVLDEEHEDMKIYRRLDPNLPPKHLACKHQLEQKTAICPEQCDGRCDPEGYNILVDWDKTRETKGAHYLHLAKPLKDLLDLYDIVKSKFFGEKNQMKANATDWLDKETTPFFLNSSGSPFKTVDLKHMSAVMGIDVSAYAHRRIISTWALSHRLEEIRSAEEEALQHSLKVAKNAYLQNKQLKPQKLTQAYIQEEGLLPDNIREEIKRTEIFAKSAILETEEKRQRNQHEALVKGKEVTKQLQQEKRPLGPRNRILEVDRNQFKMLIQEVTKENIENSLKEKKPFQFRNFFVRTVCGTKGEKGEEIRNIWTKAYKGDLKYGIRDVRLRAKENNWPRGDTKAFLRKRDRNSWIASSFLKAFQTEAKGNLKKKDIKLTK